MLRYTGGCVAFSIVLVGMAFPSFAEEAEPLRYKWQADQKFGYEVTIKGDLGNKTDTYQGSVLYSVKSVDGDTVTLAFEGGLSGSSKAKNPNEKAPPQTYNANTFHGLKQTKTDLVINSRGQVVEMKGESQLPFMLGNLSIMVFEGVPEGDYSGWSHQGGAAITEKVQSSGGPRAPGRFTIPDGGRRGGGRPIPPGRNEGGVQNGKTTAATTNEEFKKKSELKDKVFFARKYSLNAPGEETITIESTGTWTFNRALGLSETQSMNHKMMVNKGNVSLTVPVTIAYRLLTDKERDKVDSDWREAERKAKEGHEKWLAEMRQKQEEEKRQVESPLTPQEKTEVLTALGPLAPVDSMLKTFEKLKKKNVKEPDPDVVEAIRRHLKHKDDKVRMGAEDAMASWNPEYKKRYDIFSKYRTSMHNPINPPDRKVNANTKLVVGQIVLGQTWAWHWYASEVMELKADGTVVVRGVGQTNTATVGRDKIQLAHPEVEQPDAVQRQLGLAGAAPVMRTWTDSTGTFKIEATMLALVGDVVKLKRKDGREVDLPLNKLSPEDQAFAKQPVKKANPFE